MLACRAATSVHRLVPNSPELVVDGISIRASFLPSPMNASETKWGSPWRLRLVSEGPPDVQMLRITNSCVSVGENRISIVDQKAPWEGKYASLQPGEKYLNEEFGGSIETDLPAGCSLTLSISGVVLRTDGEVPFSREFEFKSMVESGTAGIDDFIMR